MKRTLAIILSACLIIALLPVSTAFAAEGRKSRLFAIDAGHGGDDPGCTGYDGRYEKNDTIKIANEVIALLEEQGQRTHLINREQKTQYRPAEANNINADYLISLHRDSSSSKSASGINIYTHEPSHRQRTEQPEKEYAPNESADKHSADDALVNNLYTCLSGATGLSVAAPHYGSASAPMWEDYYINRLSNMPSCIIEFGFATNPNDNAIFDANYKTLAKCVVKALLATIGVDYVGPFDVSSTPSICSQNGKNYYVVNGKVKWDFSGNFEYNNNVYAVTGGVAEPVAPSGGKGGITGNAKWVYFDNKLEISGGNATADYALNDMRPWSDEFTSLTVKDGVSVIGTNAFKDCTKLETVSLPSGFAEIKDGAFDGCTGLKTVNFYGTKEDFENLTVGGNNTYFTSANVLYICDLIGHTFIYECSAKCEYCNETREAYHSYDTTWSENGTEHWHECEYCGDNADLGVHNFIDNECTDCGRQQIKKLTTVNPAKQFPDVDNSLWCYDAVNFATETGIFSGYEDGHFGTANSIQRQDFILVLARFAGADLTKYESMGTTFNDVPVGQYYSAAIAWGAENGIVTGYSETNFGVGVTVSREQFVTFLYRYAKKSFYDTAVDTTKPEITEKYPDYLNVSDFAEDAMIWAVSKGALSGKNGKYLDPTSGCTRCEAAQIFYNIDSKGILVSA